MALPENDPSRKIQARSRGELSHPGSCASCGGSDPERTYVDFGLWYDYEGQIVICSLCFDEAAVKVMGYFTEEEHKTLLNANNLHLIKIEGLQNELDTLRPVVAALRSISLSSDSDVVVTGPADWVPVESTGEVEGTEPAVNDGQSEAAESSDSEGRSDTSGTESRNRSKPVIV